jgi:hypothetical protein
VGLDRLAPKLGHVSSLHGAGSKDILY